MYSVNEYHSAFTAPTNWIQRWEEYSPVTPLSAYPSNLQMFSENIAIASVRANLNRTQVIDVGFDGSVLSTPWALEEPSPMAHVDLTALNTTSNVILMLVMMNSKIGQCCQEVASPILRVRGYTSTGTGMPASVLSSSYVSFPPTYCVKRFANGMWDLASEVSFSGLWCAESDTFGIWSKTTEPFGNNVLHCAMNSLSSLTFGLTTQCPPTPTPTVITPVVAPANTTDNTTNFENVDKSEDNFESLAMIVSGTVIGMVLGASFIGVSIMRQFKAEIGTVGTAATSSAANVPELPRKTAARTAAH
jgi:hypothetical protein